MQKEMSEEVKAFEANVETGQNVKANVHVFRHIIFV